MIRLQSKLHFLHIFKVNFKTNAFYSASDELIKAIIECAINTLNGNHKLFKEDIAKLSKYKNRLRALVNPKIGFKSKSKLLILKGGFIFPLLTSFCQEQSGL